jgi:7-cyano-7-deazaguanine synthase
MRPSPDVTSAVVLLSGGQDSTTCLFWARQRWGVVHAVSVNYGQRHASELQAAREIALLGGCASHITLDVEAFSQLAGSSLVAPGDVTAVGGYIDHGHALPSTYVPGRNLVLATLGAARCAAVRASHLILGVCQTDFSGYPDCREEFVKAAELAVNLALPESCRPLEVHAPLMHLTKAEEVLLATKLPGCMGALALSVTCYRGERPGCGACPACLLRARGFAEAGVVDPAA